MSEYFLLFFSALLLMTGCSFNSDKSLPFYSDAVFTPCWECDASARTVNFPKSINHFGRSLSALSINKDLKVVHFFFSTCPGLCTKSMPQLKRVIEHSPSDVSFLSFSVTPGVDTVSQLSEYAMNNKYLFQNWHLLTGEIDVLLQFARKEFIADERSDTREFVHSELVFLLDTKNRIRGVYKSIFPADMDRLIEDIDILFSSSTK